MQQRRGTSAEWETNNPVLSLGELGFDTTNQTIRIGEGVNPWNDLDTVSGPPGPIGPGGPTGPTGPIGLLGPTGTTGSTGPTGLAAFFVSATAPTAPNDGDGWFNATTGITAVWYEDTDGGQWVEAGNSGPTGPTGPQGPAGGFATVSETAPESPASGDFWFDPTSGSLYVYFLDGTPDQWIEIMGTS